MQHTAYIAVIAGGLLLAGCTPANTEATSESRDTARVQQQQGQYEKGQPIPSFDWSLERQVVIELYQIRNRKVATHAVWRSDLGSIEGDCPSWGYPIPYDTSLTNPLMATDIDNQGEEHSVEGGSLTTIEQPEPNGIFPSKNTSATWVQCVGQGGTIEPVYVEGKVTVYPGPVVVDYASNRVTRSGAATVLIPRQAFVPPTTTSTPAPAQ